MFDDNVDVRIDYHIADSIDISKKHLRKKENQSIGWKNALKRNVLIKSFLSVFTSLAFRKSCRPTVSVLLSSLFSLIPSVGIHFGPSNHLLSVFTLLLFNDLSQSSQNIGGVLQIVVRSIMSIGIAFAASYLSLLLAFTTASPETIIVLSLFIFTVCFSFIRAYSKQWSLPMVLAEVILIVELLVGYREFEFINVVTRQLLYCALVGCSMYPIGLLIVFPTTASGVLENEILKSLDNGTQMLLLCLKSFKLDDNVEDIKTLRSFLAQNFSNLTALLEDAKIEINYGYMTANDCKAISKSMQRLIQHLGSLSSVNFSVESTGPHSNDLKQLLSAVSDSVDTLAAECISDLRHTRKYLQSHSNFDPLIVNDLEEALNYFSKNQDEIAKGLCVQQSDDWNPYSQVCMVYFWIFCFQEFASELLVLIKAVSQLQSHKSLHSPLHGWSFPVFNNNKKNKSWRVRLWELGNHTSSLAFHFAVKTALGLTLLALFAFFPSTSSFFQLWRGEWALITFSAVIAPNFGVNYINGIYRILGTVAGALWAVVTYYVFGVNPYGIFFMMLVFMVPANYFSYSTRYTKIAFVSVVALIVIIISRRNNIIMHTSRTDEIYVLGYKRAAEVTFGVICAYVLNRVLWPNLARSRLRRKMSKTLRELGDLYSKIVSAYAKHDCSPTVVKDLEKSEAKLQLKITQLKELLIFSLLEPRLLGPFQPLSVNYASLINSCQLVLDRMRSTRIALVKGFREEVTKAMVEDLLPARKDVIVDIICIFEMLSGSLYSKSPLPSYLPDAKEAQKKVSREFRNHPAVTQKLLNSANKDYLYYYAYTLATKEIIFETEKMAEELRALVGESDHLKDLWKKR